MPRPNRLSGFPLDGSFVRELTKLPANQARARVSEADRRAGCPAAAHVHQCGGAFGICIWRWRERKCSGLSIECRLVRRLIGTRHGLEN